LYFPQKLASLVLMLMMLVSVDVSNVNVFASAYSSIEISGIAIGVHERVAVAQGSTMVTRKANHAALNPEGLR